MTLPRCILPAAGRAHFGFHVDEPAAPHYTGAGTCGRQGDRPATIAILVLDGRHQRPAEGLTGGRDERSSLCIPDRAARIVGT